MDVGEVIVDRVEGVPVRPSSPQWVSPEPSTAVRNGSAAPPPRSKEFQMKFRLTRCAYLLALLAAFVVASGAGHKLGAP